MRAGFDPDMVIDLDMESFESLVEEVEADQLEERYLRFCDASLASNGEGKQVKEHAREMQRALRSARRAAPDQLGSL